ncbi:hypothetical protein N431DRAFT_451543 [Stipitochalara longipes BDJ]|nr:hypothetical protein N431DRAFT_451543 [Stipitochalara longipes BDJ]
MASLKSSHENTHPSLKGHPARVDEARPYLPPCASIEPSRSTLAGSFDVTTHPSSNQESIVRPLSATAVPPPPSSNLYAASLKDAEDCRKWKPANILQRSLSHIRSIRSIKAEGTDWDSDWGLEWGSDWDPNWKTKHITGDDIHQYPNGFPRLAAFQNANDSFLIFRGFNQLHCRVLQNLQCEISYLEKALQEQDAVDNATMALHYRLRSGKHEESWDRGKKELLYQLELKLQVYDDFCFKTSQMTKMRKIPKKSYAKLLRFIWMFKPLDEEDQDSFWHVDDLVLLSEYDDVTSAMATACNLIANLLYSCYYCLTRRHVEPRARLPTSKYEPPSRAFTTATQAVGATFIVGILLIPVFMLLWISMARLCIAATVSVSMLIFAFVMGSFPKVRTQDVLIGTAGYCAVLATCVANSGVA